MIAAPQFTVLPSPEVIPAADEAPPEIGPNLADNETFCREVAEHIQKEYFYPYWMMQQRLIPGWQFADEMWRARMKVQDLDQAFATVKPVIDGGRGNGVRDQDNVNEVKVSPAAGHKQMDSLLSLYCSISLKNGTPVRFMKPETAYEHPLYNPTEQAVEAANSAYKQNANDIDLPTIYRKNAGSFVRYNIAWGFADLRTEQEDVQQKFVLASDPMQAQVQLANLMQVHGQFTEIAPDQFGRPTVTFTKRVLKTFQTQLQHLDPDQVFVDLFIPCRPIEAQPCPIFRTHTTDFALEENEYDPQMRPLGWLNVAQAQDATRSHYAMSEADETAFRQRVTDKWGLSADSLQHHSQARIKQLWTAFPMLRVDEKRRLLDKGEGVPCEHCGGGGKMLQQAIDGSQQEAPCAQCKGKGKIRLKAQRYVVQLYGSMYSGGNTTCLRIQKNPTAKNKVPLIFASLMVEDNAGSIPTSKADIAKYAYRQLATAESQFIESKNKTINRPFKKKIDSPAWTVDCNEAGAVIPFDIDPGEVERVEGNQFDETATLMPFMDHEAGEVQMIFGVTDSQMGMLAPGRRPASEMVNAFEAGRVPIIVQMDQYNYQMWGQHAQLFIDNFEVYGDRDWIKQRTGRTTFGRLGVFHTTAQEFVERMALVNNAQYLLQATAVDPTMQGIRADLYGTVLDGMGLQIDRSKFDGGLKKAQVDALTIVAKILGDGQFVPPSESDPHQVYVDIFNEALKDEYWINKAPQNLPLLMQRVQIQQMLLQQQMMQQMQMQLIMGGPQQEEGASSAGQEPGQKKSAPTPGKQFQQAQG